MDFVLSRIDSIMGGFLLRKKSEKCITFSRPEFALQTRTFQGSSAKALPFLRYASELACASLYNPCHRFKIENETVN